MTDSPDNLTGILSEAFANVSDWLKFAEQKNAALIAFNSALSLGVLAVLQDLAPSMFWLRLLCALSIGFLWLGAVVALWSFIPTTRIPKPHQWSGGLRDDNLLFFGHIARYTPETYLKAMSELVGAIDGSATRLDKHYAEQVVTNARIAIRKYALFSESLWLTLSAFLTPLVYVLRVWRYILAWRSSR